MNHVSATTITCSCSAIFLILIKADYWITQLGILTFWDDATEKKGVEVMEMEL
jgi:hypothetical protein